MDAKRPMRVSRPALPRRTKRTPCRFTRKVLVIRGENDYEGRELCGYED